MSWVLAIDFGTANTTAAHAGDGAAPQPLTLEGLPSLPSVVAADPDGRLVVGRAARSQAYLDPERAEPPSPERPVAENPGGGQITAARWTPDDRYLLTSLGNRSRPADQVVGVALWDAASGEPVRSWTDVSGEFEPCRGIALSSDGTRIACVRRDQPPALHAVSAI